MSDKPKREIHKCCVCGRFMRKDEKLQDEYENKYVKWNCVKLAYNDEIGHYEHE